MAQLRTSRHSTKRKRLQVSLSNDISANPHYRNTDCVSITTSPAPIRSNSLCKIDADESTNGLTSSPISDDTTWPPIKSSHKIDMIASIDSQNMDFINITSLPTPNDYEINLKAASYRRVESHADTMFEREIMKGKDLTIHQVKEEKRKDNMCIINWCNNEQHGLLRYKVIKRCLSCYNNLQREKKGRV